MAEGYLADRLAAAGARPVFNPAGPMPVAIGDEGEDLVREVR